MTDLQRNFNELPNVVIDHFEIDQERTKSRKQLLVRLIEKENPSKIAKTATNEETTTFCNEFS